MSPAASPISADRARYDAEVARGFDALAPGYDAAYPRSRSLVLMREAAAAALRRLARPGTWWMDLGAGTGRDTLALAARGVNVLAVDPSPGMLGVLRRRLGRAARAGTVRVERRGTGTLAELLPSWKGRLHGIAALFGALNYEPEPWRLPDIFHRLLRPGGRLLVAVRNRVCPWEVAYHLAYHPSLRLAFRRFRARGADTDVGGRRLTMRVYSPGELRRLLAPRFAQTELQGLSVTLPPYMMAGFPRRWPRLERALAALEPRVAGWPVLRGLGDHFLAAYRRRGGAT